MRFLFNLALAAALSMAMGCSVTDGNLSPRRSPGDSLLVLQTQGQAYYTSGQTTVPIKRGLQIPCGAMIHTKQDSFVDLCVQEGIRVRIMSEAKVGTDASRRPDSHLRHTLDLKQGSLLCVATVPDCEAKITITVNTLFIYVLLPGEIEVSASGDTSVYKGKAALIEAMDIVRNVFLFIGERQIGKPDSNEIISLPSERNNPVEKAFQQLKAAKCD